MILSNWVQPLLSSSFGSCMALLAAAISCKRVFPESLVENGSASPSIRVLTKWAAAPVLQSK
jgi:hypothetical protein